MENIQSHWQTLQLFIIKIWAFQVNWHVICHCKANVVSRLSDEYHRKYALDLGLHVLFDRVKHVCYYYSINHLARHIVTWRELYLFSGVYWMSLQVQLCSVINAPSIVICRWFLGRLKPTQYIVRVWMGHYYGIHTLLFRGILETYYGVELDLIMLILYIR